MITDGKLEELKACSLLSILRELTLVFIIEKFYTITAYDTWILFILLKQMQDRYGDSPWIQQGHGFCT